MNFKVTGGVYPTMVTPYKNGNIDWDAVGALVEWYFKEGCDGIFAACQSSEIMFLSLEERVKLARTVKSKAESLAAADRSKRPMMVVASGHISDAFADQVKELDAIAATGVDALILISNRMDIANTSDEAWIADTEKLIMALPQDIPLGVYECPKPYKRLLTEKMIKYCAGTGRFFFIKDTCCDASKIAERVKWCALSQLKIFNANAQTLLETLRAGVYGYCGVMANFHPAIYKWLCENFISQPEAAEKVQAFLGLAAFTESLTYPSTAKYHLDRNAGVKMAYEARSCDVNNLTDYQKSCIDQMNLLAGEIIKNIRRDGGI